MGQNSKKRNKRRLKKRVKLYLFIFLMSFIAFALLAVSPWIVNTARMNFNAVVKIKVNSSKQRVLTWDRADKADGYVVELQKKGGKNSEILCKADVEKEEFIVPDNVPLDKKISICIKAKSSWSFMDKEYHFTEQRGLKISVYLDEPEIADVETNISMADEKMYITWKGYSTDTFLLVQTFEDGSRKIIKRYGYSKTNPLNFFSNEGRKIRNYAALLYFGEGKNLPIPKKDDKYNLEIIAVRKESHLEFFGDDKLAATITANEFLPAETELAYEEISQNNYKLMWTEFQANGYEIQMRGNDNQEWKTLRKLSIGSECEYETGRLSPGKKYIFRIAPGGIDTGKKDYSEKSGNPDIVVINTQASPMYATIWPTKQLVVYSDAKKTSRIDNVKSQKALCVLGEDSGMFKIQTERGKGYIDSSYCMINLPEYLGDICEYDITNSYASIYLIHNFAIPNVSATVIPGYENILLDDDTFLVPLLYPCAKKLLNAANAAKADGHKIKIYDSFRPHKATRYIYDETAKILDFEVPSHEYSRITLDMYRKLIDQGYRQASEAVPEDEWPQKSIESSSASQDYTIIDNTVFYIDERVLGKKRVTYRRTMTNGSYSLGNFLAAKGSTHNYGIAMDMTLVSDKGRDFDMQTNMHDLSYYSALSKNNSNANLLQKYMKAAGYGILSSEWWHFQDNETRAKTKAVPLEEGVSIEGWKKDDKGWKYRLSSGKYYKNQKIKIGDKEYAFDESGYTSR